MQYPSWMRRRGQSRSGLCLGYEWSNLLVVLLRCFSSPPWTCSSLRRKDVCIFFAHSKPSLFHVILLLLTSRTISSLVDSSGIKKLLRWELFGRNQLWKQKCRRLLSIIRISFLFTKHQATSRSTTTFVLEEIKNAILTDAALKQRC